MLLQVNIASTTQMLIEEVSTYTQYTYTHTHLSSKGVGGHEASQKLHSILSDVAALVLSPAHHQRQNGLETRQGNGLRSETIKLKLKQ